MDLREKLYEKAKKLNDQFIDDLKGQSPENIILASYEKVIRDDILIIFESDELPLKQVRELLKLEDPIGECYAKWLHNDYSHMDMLRDTIGDFANDLIKYAHKQEKKKQEVER